MTDAIRAVSDTLSPSSTTMPGSFPLVSTQRHRPTIVLQRSASAPNLRSPPGSASASASSGEVGTSGSSSSSRSSYSHPEWRPHEFHHQPRSHTTPLTPVHDRGRSRRSTFERISVPASAPPPAPGHEIEEEISQNMEVMARRLEEIRRNLSMRRRRTSRVTLSDLWVALRGLFGYGPEGTAARRELVSLAGKLLFGTGQVRFILISLPSDKCMAFQLDRRYDYTLMHWRSR